MGWVLLSRLFERGTRRDLSAFVRARKAAARHIMTTELKGGRCVSLRNTQFADLPAILDLLRQADLPAAGVTEALPHFLVAESEDQIPARRGKCNFPSG